MKHYKFEKQHVPIQLEGTSIPTDAVPDEALQNRIG